MNMNNDHFEQEIQYHLLNILNKEGNLTQREMAQRVGISLGKLNYVISGLAEKGLVKIKRFKNSDQRLSYLYLLTPRGMEEKAMITIDFLKRKMQEYDEIKRQINELTREIEREGWSERIA